MMAAAEAIVLRPQPESWSGGASNFSSEDGSTFIGSGSLFAGAEGGPEKSVNVTSPPIDSGYEQSSLASILGITFSDREAHSMTEPATIERVAKLEAGMDTIRAEIKAGSAETREAVLTAVERLRADYSTHETKTVREVMGLRIWILTGVASILVWVLGVAVWAVKELAQPLMTVLQHAPH